MYKEKTAIDYLENNHDQLDGWLMSCHFEEAATMFRKQIEAAYKAGYANGAAQSKETETDYYEKEYNTLKKDYMDIINEEAVTVINGKKHLDWDKAVQILTSHGFKSAI